MNSSRYTAFTSSIVFSLVAMHISVSKAPADSGTPTIVNTSAPATRPASASTALVEIENFNFEPTELEVRVGTQVTWQNTDDVPHTVTSKDNPQLFDSGALDTDEKFFFAFSKPGKYACYCKAVARIHALPEPPSLVLHTGDLTHLSRPQEFDTVAQVMKSIKTQQSFYVPGEHDYFVDNGKRHLERFGKGTKGTGWQSFDFSEGNARVGELIPQRVKMALMKEGARPKRIAVVPYDTRWVEDFAAASAEVAAAMGPNLLEIHHIGSTAISGIFAKPVIDMLAVVLTLAAVDQHAAQIELLGYEAMGEFGIEGRRYFRRNNAEEVRTHQIHTFERRSEHIERHLAFRDFMRAHVEIAAQYSELKRTLAEVHPNDINAYMDGKDSFIKEMERRALAWVAGPDGGRVRPPYWKSQKDVRVR